MNDLDYMKEVFKLAKLGAGVVNPNPMVGAIIVKDDRIISKGYHAKVGSSHAEADAFNKASENIKGATLYCNLEPCCHTNKRTPPCAQRIIKEGIKKVVIANFDPNPEVSGKGVKLLEDHGIEVVTGVLEEEGFELNEIFFTHITKNRAFVEVKIAQTLDGKVATSTGNSKWITNEESRKAVHRKRLRYDAILVGANTVRADNPSLTVRLNEETAKLRIILSSDGDFDPKLKLFSDEYKDLTWIVLPSETKPKINHQFINCPKLNNGNFDLNALSKILYSELNVTSIYVEGGQKVHTQFIKQSAYDRLSVFIAPKILGNGHNAIGDLNINLMSEALELKKFKTYYFGNDLLITAINEDICSQD